MNAPHEILPLVDLNASRTKSFHTKTTTSKSQDTIRQNLEDANAVIKLAGLDIDLDSENIIEASEKYMIETRPNNTISSSSEKMTTGLRQKGSKRPHYTHILVLDNKLILQSACCLPLKVIAASLDGNNISGRILYNKHSGKSGGKLVYEFIGKGKNIILDLKRGDSSKAQRLFFTF